MADVDVNEPAADLDVSQWPLLVITIPEGKVSDACVNDVLVRYNQLIREKKERYALVVDVSKSEKLNSKQRKIMSEQMNSNREFTGKYCAGTALVFDSVLIAGMLTAVFWVFKPKYETKVFTKTHESIAWAKSQL